MQKSKRNKDLSHNKNDAVCQGFNNAKFYDYKRRNVLRDLNSDLYYSGWMDCFEWMSKNIVKK